MLGWGQQAESWWDTARKDADSHHEHLLCQRAKEMLLQQRRVSNHQMQGTISRCWGNVSLPQLGKVLTTVMAELLCNPFFSLLFTRAKAISKFNAVTKLRREGDDYRGQQYSACKPKHFLLCNAMAYTLQAFCSVLPTVSGSLLSRVLWLLSTCQTHILPLEVFSCVPECQCQLRQQSLCCLGFLLH